MDPLVPLALSVAPELARSLFGTEVDKASAAVAEAFHAAIGTSDVEAATTLLQQSPATASHLRVQLLQVGAGLEETARVAAAAELTASLTKTDVDEASADVPSSGVPGWSASVVSLVVLASFGTVVAIILLKGVPAGNETTANMLLGTLAAMTTSVVSYWVGSSAGSARKEARLAQISK